MVETEVDVELDMEIEAEVVCDHEDTFAGNTYDRQQVLCHGILLAGMSSPWPAWCLAGRDALSLAATPWSS